MARFVLRRLAIIPVVLLLVNFVAYTYAHLVPSIRVARTPYFFGKLESGPFLPAYRDYLEGAVRLDLGTLPFGQAGRMVTGVIAEATVASLGLLGLGLVLSALLGVVLGLIAVRVMPARVARWLTYLSTVGLAMPSFYIGSLTIMAVFYYVVWRPGTGLPLPIKGFGWDLHLVLPVLVLMVRPTMHIARLTAGLLVDELGKRYVVTARSVGYGWGTIRWRHALRSILAPVILTVAGSVRLLMGELVLVEWLFGWPGLGLLLAQSLIPPGTNVGLFLAAGFLHPPVVATVVTVFAAVFLVTDLVAAVLTHAADPRLRATEEGTTSADVVADPYQPGRRNWVLLVGAGIVLLVIAIAILGPALAPKDPLERNSLIRVGDDWVTPSFPAFTVPGFPLGSDRFGRDLLSRLMWAVRPTMIMVAIVAFVRLVLGTLLGLGAGWSSGRVGRLLDMAIAVALSLPVLLVALFLIAAIGIEQGLLAFIIGLSVTGWAETARIVRQQTPEPTVPPQPLDTALPPADTHTEGIWHTVREGESLPLIARRYGTTSQAIVRANHLAGRDQIYVGQRLKIPVARDPAGGLEPPCRIRHTVKEGEWLRKIAEDYGVSPYEIMNASDLTIETADMIHPGQVLCIP